MSTQSHLHDEGAMDLFLSLAPLCTSNSCYFSTCVNVFTLQYSLSTNIMALWLLNSLWIKYFMYPLKKRGGGVSINSFFHPVSSQDNRNGINISSPNLATPILHNKQQRPEKSSFFFFKFGATLTETKR